jgi:secreted trypsin-like serine protease
MTVVGIVSFGPNKCCVTKFPVGFTQVFKYVEWILDNSMID